MFNKPLTEEDIKNRLITPALEKARIIGTGSSTQKSEPMYLSPMIQNTIRKIIEKED